MHQSYIFAQNEHYKYNHSGERRSLSDAHIMSIAKVCVAEARELPASGFVSVSGSVFVIDPVGKTVPTDGVAARVK